MDLIQYIKQLEALLYSAIINFLLAVVLYFIFCQIPFTKMEILIGCGLWFVYFGFVYIVYYFVSFAFTQVKKIMLSLFAVFTGVIVLFSFHFIIDGFDYHDSKIKVAFLLLVVLCADIPFLVSFMLKKPE